MLTLIAFTIASQVDAGSSFTERMRDPARRNDAACEALKPEDAEPCVVSSVLESIDAKGAAVFLVFFHHESQTEQSDRPLGHFELFDRTGTHLRWYENANVLRDDDVILRPANRPLVVVQSINHQTACDERSMVQTLHVISVAAPTSPLLNVIVGPSTADSIVVKTVPAVEPAMQCSGCICVGPVSGSEVAPAFTWSWAARCAADCRVELGPREALRAGRPVAVFRWKPAATKIEGARGATDAGFLRYEPRAEDAAIDAFTARHGISLGCARTGCGEESLRVVKKRRG